MYSSLTPPPNQLRTTLAHALGFRDYPSNLAADPYLNYIANRRIRGTRDEYFELFVRIVEHFSGSHTPPGSIRALLDALASEELGLFADTKPGSVVRNEDVEDTVMYILGVWSMLLSSFVQLPSGMRKVTTAFCIRAQKGKRKEDVYDQNLAELIQGSHLIPVMKDAQSVVDAAPDMDAAFDEELVRTTMRLVALLSQTNRAAKSTTLSRMTSSSEIHCQTGPMVKSSRTTDDALEAMDSLESLSIKATRLNAFTLHELSAVEISWTHNISRHMLLSHHDGRDILELFALPTAFKARTLASNSVGISPDFAQEVQESYCILFNAWSEQSWHARYLGVRKFCWCWSCSAHRYRNQITSKYQQSFQKAPRRGKRARRDDLLSEYDPFLVNLMNLDASDWSQDMFPGLWPRIRALEEHLQSAKPWSIWVLFRDRRDTLQFWTFFFATVVLFLTFVQVALGVAQVVGSFK